jgi:CheY-like chemotaxis protein
MAPEVTARAFEPFYTTKEVGKGSGLGLSMVYGFAKQSNGHVSISSEVGLGTMVRIYLPRVPAQPAAISEPLAVTEEAVAGGRETILIVEDDPFVRSSVILRVESLGYAVVTAVNGEEALRKLRSHPRINLLFTDIVMPGGISGWELAERAWEIRPGLPTLLSSGYSLDALLEQGRVPQHAIILKKPYRKAELARLLRQALALSLTAT